MLVYCCVDEAVACMQVLLVQYFIFRVTHKHKLSRVKESLVRG